MGPLLLHLLQKSVSISRINFKKEEKQLFNKFSPLRNLFSRYNAVVKKSSIIVVQKSKL